MKKCMALFAALVVSACLVIFAPSAATADEGPREKTISWIIPNGGTPQNVTWPQPVASEANLALIPCGTSVWLQVDTYPYGTYEQKARTDALAADGILTYGEDHGWGVALDVPAVHRP